MASASSRMISLKELMDAVSDIGAAVNICLVPDVLAQHMGFCQIGVIQHTGECFDLFPHDINASVVTGVEFQDHLAHVLHAINSPRQGQDG